MSDVIYTTGITGFIGRNLLHTLLEKYNFVLNFERKQKISIHQKNAKKILKDFDFKILEDYSSEILIHLATLYNPSPKNEFEENEILQSNLNFPIQVCKTLEEINLKKIITTSSYIQLIPEDEQNLYAKSKSDFIKWAEQTFEITEIFLFDSFGSDDNREKVIDIFIKKSLLNEEINIPEKKGTFSKLCKSIGQKNITEFSYRLDKTQEAKILLGLEFNKGEKEKNSFIKSMKLKKYKITDLSDDEISKVHLRYMSGGRAPELSNGETEEVFKVDFPERPGALMQFLDLLKDKWNISLFHYKNQGSIYGGALVGFSIKSSQLNKLNKDLLNTEYPFTRVSENAGYKAFLK